MMRNKLNTFLVFSILLAPSVCFGVEELAPVESYVSDWVNHLSKIVGIGSIGIGVWRVIETQSPKVAAISMAITCSAFKFPSWLQVLAG